MSLGNSCEGACINETLLVLSEGLCTCCMNYLPSELKATEVNSICVFSLTKKSEEMEKNPQKVTCEDSHLS